MALPQGLVSDPRVFTKLMKPPFAELQKLEYTLIGYINDCLVVADGPLEIMDTIDKTVKLFDTLSRKKPVLEPVTSI